MIFYFKFLSFSVSLGCCLGYFQPKNQLFFVDLLMAFCVFGQYLTPFCCFFYAVSVIVWRAPHNLFGGRGVRAKKQQSNIRYERRIVEIRLKRSCSL